MRATSSLLILLATACGRVEERLEVLEGVEPACEPRVVAHPDADGDGLGDAETVYVGCEAPAGWIPDGSDCDDADPDVGVCDTGPG
jgi:hypothetical protein